MSQPGADDPFMGFSTRRVRYGDATPTRPPRPEDPRYSQTRSPDPMSRDNSPFRTSIPPAPVFGTPGTGTPPPEVPTGVTPPRIHSLNNPFANTVPEPAAPTGGNAGNPVPNTSDTTAQLAGAIAYLAQSITYDRAAQNQNQGGGSSERNNVREPDQFDGTEPNKLRLFFAQLELVFKARPRTFNSEEKKVTYGISYLKGTALQWFEPYLLESDSETPPVFMSDYEAFQDELRVNFGPYDVSGAAEHDLMNLRMSDNHRIAKYITQFTRLATQVRWGSTLR